MSNSKSSPAPHRQTQPSTLPDCFTSSGYFIEDQDRHIDRLAQAVVAPLPDTDVGRLVALYENEHLRAHLKDFTVPLRTSPGAHAPRLLISIMNESDEEGPDGKVESPFRAMAPMALNPYFGDLAMPDMLMAQAAIARQAEPRAVFVLIWGGRNSGEEFERRDYSFAFLLHIDSGLSFTYVSAPKVLYRFLGPEGEIAPVPYDFCDSFSGDAGLLRDFAKSAAGVSKPEVERLLRELKKASPSLPHVTPETAVNVATAITSSPEYLERLGRLAQSTQTEVLTQVFQQMSCVRRESFAELRSLEKQNTQLESRYQETVRVLKEKAARAAAEHEKKFVQLRTTIRELNEQANAAKRAVRPVAVAPSVQHEPTEPTAPCCLGSALAGLFGEREPEALAA